MKTKYILRRIEDKITSIKEEKERFQKFRKERPEILNKEKWLEEKRRGFNEVLEILGLPESQKRPITYALKEMMNEVFDFAVKYFELYEKHLEILNNYYAVENKFIQAQTLVWYQFGCITGDFTNILSTSELLEMSKMMMPNHLLNHLLRLTYNKTIN